MLLRRNKTLKKPKTDRDIYFEARDNGHESMIFEDPSLGFKSS